MSECESLVVEERESVCVCVRERESWKGGREGGKDGSPRRRR